MCKIPSISTTRLGRRSRLPARFREPNPNEHYAMSVVPLTMPVRGAECRKTLTVAPELQHHDAPGNISTTHNTEVDEGSAGSSSQSSVRLYQTPKRARSVHALNRGQIERSGPSIQEQYRLMLTEKDVDIEELRARIRRLEQSERRLKRQQADGSDRLANKEAELGEVRQALHDVEDKLDKQSNSVRELAGEADRYRRWWLNEYYSLKVALNLARDRNDRGIVAMKESSQARFVVWAMENNYQQ